MGALEKRQPFDTIEVHEAKAGVRISMGALRRKAVFVFRALSPNKPQVSFCAAESCGHKMAQALP
jgi:hypothetical protein